jgi:hypothetical protein
MMLSTEPPDTYGMTIHRLWLCTNEHYSGRTFACACWRMVCASLIISSCSRAQARRRHPRAAPAGRAGAPGRQARTARARRIGAHAEHGCGMAAGRRAPGCS